MSKASENKRLALLSAKSDELISQLPDCCQLYFRNIRIEEKSENTVYQYAFDILRFIRYLEPYNSDIKNKPHSIRIDEILGNLNKEDLMEYIEDIRTIKTSTGTSKASPLYVSRKMSSLKSFFRFYYENGYLKSNPSELLHNPKVRNKNIVILEFDEIERLMDEVNKAKHSVRDKAILSLALSTGARVSELVNIDLKDLDEKELTIRVVRKGGDEDELYISPAIYDTLKDYIDGERAEILGNIKEPALFVSNQKRRITVRSVELLIKKYSQEAGLNKNITPHVLRKTFGTELYETTGDVFLTANALHHKSIETTRKHYVKSKKDLERDAITGLKIIK